MAAIAFLSIITTITILLFFATAFLASHAEDDDVCIPSGPPGNLNYEWNETRFAKSNVQVGVLLFLQSELQWNIRFRNREGSNIVDVCKNGTFSSGNSGGNDYRGTEVFVFARCKGDIGGKRCENCVGNATLTLRANCPDAVGAQASSADCCLRYETYKFC